MELLISLVQGKVHKWELYTLNASFCHIYLECCDVRQYCTLIASQRSFYLKCFSLFQNYSWIYKIKDKLSNESLVVIFAYLLKPDLGTLKAMKICYWIFYDWQKFFLRSCNVLATTYSLFIMSESWVSEFVILKKLFSFHIVFLFLWFYLKSFYFYSSREKKSSLFYYLTCWMHKYFMFRLQVRRHLWVFWKLCRCLFYTCK